MSRYPLGSIGGLAPAALYDTADVSTLKSLFHMCQSECELGFCYGPAGTGKTYTLRQLVAAFNRSELSKGPSGAHAHHVTLGYNIQPRDMLARIAAEVRATVAATRERCLNSLYSFLRHRQTLLVLDEVQDCGIASLETLRELYDRDLRLGMLLAGHHKFKVFLDQHAAELDQWNSRIDAGRELFGLDEIEARTILRCELPDAEEATVLATLKRSPMIGLEGKRFNFRRLMKNVRTAKRDFAQLDNQENAA